MAIEALLKRLPSSRNYNHIMRVKDGESRGIAYCGDNAFGLFPIYKFLSRESIMHTYYRFGPFLIQTSQQRIHR